MKTLILATALAVSGTFAALAEGNVAVVEQWGWGNGQVTAHVGHHNTAMTL